MKDPDFLNAIREIPCIACGAWGSTEAHHIKTKGAGGGNQAFNVIPLCSGCHTQEEFAFHRSKTKFFSKFPHVKDHMINLGWEFIGHKLFNKGFRE